MHKALEERKARQEELIALAREYADLVARELGPLCAVLTGSVPRGDFNLHSDIDVLIISDRLPASPLQRSKLLYQYALPLIEPKGYLPSEFTQLLARSNPLATDALAYGLLLRDNGFWSNLQPPPANP